MWHPIKHFKTIHHHKVLVRRYCFRCGLYWQGLTHDLSKLAPVEFLAGARYWQDSCSPNNAQRQAEGYSAACTTRAATATTWNTGSTIPPTATTPWPACACRKSMWPR